MPVATKIFEGFPIEFSPLPADLAPATLDGLTLTVEGQVSPEGLQILLFGRVTAHKCRRGAWCDWTVLGRSAVCTIGGEIASVGTDGEIAKLEVFHG
jgi:hypothetical protein